MILCANEPFDFCQCPHCGPFATAIVPLYLVAVGGTPMCKGCRSNRNHCAAFDGGDGGGDGGGGEPVEEEFEKAA